MSSENMIAAQWLRPIDQIKEHLAWLPANTAPRVEAIEGELDQLEATLTGATEHLIMANAMLGVLIEDFDIIRIGEVKQRLKTIQQGIDSLVIKSGGEDMAVVQEEERDPPMYFFDPEDPTARIKIIEREPGCWGFMHMKTLFQWGRYADEYAAIAVASMNFQEVQS